MRALEPGAHVRVIEEINSAFLHSMCTHISGELQTSVCGGQAPPA